MISYDEVKDFYLNSYKTKLQEISEHHGSDEDKEREAQKYAIKITALNYFTNYPKENKRKIWNMIYSAHVARKCGVDIPAESIEKVISSDQSWKKSSGHAFEEMVKELASNAVKDSGISILLQKDLLIMIKLDQLKNEERDKEWLLKQIAEDTFDLFAVAEGQVFGCVQAKTSIRDRVTRDREPSLLAMDRFFWSFIFVLDGDFLKLPKFRGMVNGLSDSFATNGWHSLYVFSSPKNAIGGRIFELDSYMEPFRKHAIKALSDWKQKRQWFNHDWIPEVK